MNILPSALGSSRPVQATRPFACRTVATLIEINGSLYRVTPIEGITDPTVKLAFRMEKVGDPEAVYDVAAVALGIGCSCPSWVCRHDDFTTSGCKHIKALCGLGFIDRKALGFDPEPVQAAPAPLACCDPAEQAPCAGCLGPEDVVTAMVALLSTPAAVEPTAAPKARAKRLSPRRQPRLFLHEVVAAQAARMRDRETAVGNLMADELDRLAGAIWLSRSRSIATFESRRNVADRRIDERFERLRGQDADQDPRWSDEPIGW